MRAGAERAEITIEKVLRELAVLGFSDIGKVVRWRPEQSTSSPDLTLFLALHLSVNQQL
jgi:hypothetical protein